LTLPSHYYSESFFISNACTGRILFSLPFKLKDQIEIARLLANVHSSAKSDGSVTCTNVASSPPFEFRPRDFCPKGILKRPGLRCCSIQICSDFGIVMIWNEYFFVIFNFCGVSRMRAECFQRGDYTARCSELGFHFKFIRS